MYEILKLKKKTQRTHLIAPAPESIATPGAV